MKNPFGVDQRFVAKPQHFFIASAFAFIDKPFSDPSHKRIEPKQRLSHHVNRCREIVAAADMAQFVDKDSLQLIRWHPSRNAVGQQQDWLEYTEHGRLQQRWRRHCPKRYLANWQIQV